MQTQSGACQSDVQVPTGSTLGVQVECGPGNYEVEVLSVYSPWNQENHPDARSDVARAGQWRSKVFLYLGPPDSIPWGAAPYGSNAPIRPYRELGHWEEPSGYKADAQGRLALLAPRLLQLDARTSLTFVVVDDNPWAYEGNRDRFVSLRIRPVPIPCPGAVDLRPQEAEGVTVTCPRGDYLFQISGAYSSWQEDRLSPDGQGQWRSLVALYRGRPTSVPRGRSARGDQAPIGESALLGAWEGPSPAADLPPAKSRAAAEARSAQTGPLRTSLGEGDRLTFVTIDDNPYAYFDNRGSIRVTIIPTGPRTTRRLGVHLEPEWDRAKDEARLDLAASIGAAILRVPISWAKLQPRLGEWDPQADEFYLTHLSWLADAARARGIALVVLLAQTPEWAADPRASCGSVEKLWSPPANAADYAAAFAHIVPRFAGRVEAWQIWNEPNRKSFWCPTAGTPPPDEDYEAQRNFMAQFAPDYARLVRAASPAIKSADPSALVVAGSIGDAETVYLRALYRAGIKGAFDVLAIHPYSYDRSPQDCLTPESSFSCLDGAGGIPAVRRIMVQEFADDRPLWLTEFGWSSLDRRSGDDGQFDPLIGGGVGPEDQVRYLAQAVDLLDAWSYVHTAIWYELTDRDVAVPRERHFGLFLGDAGRTPKPAAAAFRSRAPNPR